MDIATIRPSRRAFLAGTGLVIGVTLLAPNARAALIQGAKEGAEGQQADLNAFVRVAPDNTVTVLSKHIEFGQGPYTGLTTLVAEELDADWSQMRVAAAPANQELYKNLAFGLQGTGGSTSIANSYGQMRKAGATAKAMLVAAAAKDWNVSADEITVVKGRIRHEKSGKESGFGAFADKAAKTEPPKDVALKDPKNFTLIGQDRHKLDTDDKTDGKAVFTLDVLADDMLIAMVAHADHFGATVKAVDDSAARAIKGVVDVKPIPQGVAVFAEDTFTALKARAALKIDWDLSKAETRSSQQIVDDYRAEMKGKGLKAANKGDVDGALASEGITSLDTEIVFPFLAHAPMEPLDAVLIRAADGSIDCYNGSQFPGQDQKAIADICGVDPSKVRINMQLAGGSFGRRAQFGSPYMREAAAAFKASGMTRPVKHMWTREDDIRGGFYRPIYVHSIKGAVDKTGAIVGWDQKIAGQSIMGKDELDETTVEGASDMPYAIDNLRVVAYQTKLGVPVLWWRSVGHTHTAFAVETFLDRLLERAGKDPVEGRLALLKDSPRHLGVLKKVAEMADWGHAALPDGHQRGVAVHKSFNTYVAEIVEASLDDTGLPKVQKVWCAVDCGVAVNPNIIKAQMEGGIGYGLGAILFDAIDLTDGGAVVQSNFNDYRSLRITEMPHVEVAIIPSSEAPTGVGEPGVPPIGPAVANAWRRLTGRPVQRLPLSRDLVA
ncbi:xanthine dehydrogenase family protein molybdopterin-binding subunit [Jiella sp. MQZ9-1]|uniref:Xanthine dehydrogenase family protein molybdopterin-binding subunit n=1 Tax=Jiella flava TaxID=2816857 RepID=A0A939FVC6_9HYPH|nr:xanthine dehydrogenase family protein molybdopterin-binding subunit [Jiella flava]MBO0662187.1 xanthine dehydrogenase family protein molybdopterin-binding subunit [Jiella flava]MCD2470983.1 xanthine dehydrogenase family protein molybdopterin-binding subunit [Jiella flava]